MHWNQYMLLTYNRCVREEEAAAGINTWSAETESSQCDCRCCAKYPVYEAAVKDAWDV